jgi:hypothetical protein
MLNLFAIKKQLKDLTIIFCFQIPCYKLYKEGLFFHILTLKYKCHFGLSSKRLNLKIKHKIKKTFHGYSSIFLTYL